MLLLHRMAPLQRRQVPGERRRKPQADRWPRRSSRLARHLLDRVGRRLQRDPRPPSQAHFPIRARRFLEGRLLKCTAPHLRRRMERRPVCMLRALACLLAALGLELPRR